MMAAADNGRSSSCEPNAFCAFRTSHLAVAVQERSNHNKACCALANNLARIAYACWREHVVYDECRPNSRLATKKYE